MTLTSMLGTSHGLTGVEEDGGAEAGQLGAVHALLPQTTHQLVEHARHNSAKLREARVLAR